MLVLVVYLPMGKTCQAILVNVTEKRCLYFSGVLIADFEQHFTELEK